MQPHRSHRERKSAPRSARSITPTRRRSDRRSYLSALPSDPDPEEAEDVAFLHRRSARDRRLTDRLARAPQGSGIDGIQHHLRADNQGGGGISDLWAFERG